MNKLNHLNRLNNTLMPKASEASTQQSDEFKHTLGRNAGQVFVFSNHSWINYLPFGLATLIRTLTPCGLQAGEPRRIHTELHQQGGIPLYQINCTTTHVRSCCIIEASLLLFFLHDKINYGNVFSSRAVISGVWKVQ